MLCTSWRRNNDPSSSRVFIALRESTVCIAMENLTRKTGKMMNAGMPFFLDLSQRLVCRPPSTVDTYEVIDL